MTNDELIQYVETGFHSLDWGQVVQYILLERPDIELSETAFRSYFPPPYDFQLLSVHFMTVQGLNIATWLVGGLGGVLMHSGNGRGFCTELYGRYPANISNEIELAKERIEENFQKEHNHEARHPGP